MTARTPGIPAVIARIVALQIMAEVRWRPTGSHVAAVALYGGRQVVLRLERSSAARTMAISTPSDRATIVYPRTANESSCRMAGTAIQRSCDMVAMFADGRRTVVTRTAIIDDSGVVKACWNKSAGVVADAAILVGGQMVTRLGRRKTGVVAGCTVVDNSRVIEHGGQEAGCLMTVDAVCTRWHMIKCLAGRSIAIMT